MKVTRFADQLSDHRVIIKAMEICSYLIVGKYIEKRWAFFSILVGCNYTFISWMCANLNVYLITKANNDKPVLNFEFSFSVNFFFVLTWRKLF